MKIRISKREGRIEADPVDLPGSPAVGRGKTIPEALGNFVIAHQRRLGLIIETDESAKADEEARRRQELHGR